MKPVFVIFICLVLVTGLPAQAQDSLDWDIGAVFGEPSPETPIQAPATPAPPAQQTPKPPTPVPAAPVSRQVQRRGYSFTAGYEFAAGIVPGWRNMPGSSEWDTSDYFLDRFILMRSWFTVDAQISEDLRVLSRVNFEIPGGSFTMGDFFFDYKLYNKVFLRGGKFNQAWGISPNYGFTNLLARIPKDAAKGDSYIFKVDVPYGNGGFQALTMTRLNLRSNTVLPEMKDFGYGGKFNQAYRKVDFDTGLFYQEGMALRFFTSIKTTVKRTELYTEWLSAIDVDKFSGIKGAFNIGFARDFFDKKLDVNGELLYNGETDTYWYSHSKSWRSAETFRFVEGFNMAFNMQYKPWEKGSPRLFAKVLYAPEQNSAQLIPGFRFTPWRHLEFYIAAPMSLGSEEGFYYFNSYNSFTVNKERTPLPFNVVFMMTLNGSVRVGHYN